MRPTIRWTAAVLPLLLAACSTGAPPPAPAAPRTSPPTAAATSAPAVDLSTFRRGEIPAEYPDGDLSGLPPEPDDTAPVPDRIEWEALEAVTNFASTVDPEASASCPAFDPAAVTSVTCTVQFLGDAYDYEVSGISFTPSGLRRSDGGAEHGFVEYHATLTAGPVVRDFVEAVLRYQHATEYTVCDMGDHVRLPFTDEHERPSGSAGLTGESILVTGVECRALDVGTGHVTTVDLELYEWGSPIHPSSRVPGG